MTCRAGGGGEKDGEEERKMEGGEDSLLTLTYVVEDGNYCCHRPSLEERREVRWERWKQLEKKDKIIVEVWYAMWKSR